MFNLLSIFFCGLSIFALMYVPKLPLETLAKFNCNTQNTTIRIHLDNNQLNVSNTEYYEENMCNFNCDSNDSFNNVVQKSWNLECCFLINNFNASLKKMEKIENVYNYFITYVQINETKVINPTCVYLVETQCKISCYDSITMKIVTQATYTGNLIELNSFWIFIIVLSIIWASMAVIWSTQDSICIDILGENTKDFGKQRAWGSLGWGLASIIGGLLVDHFSGNKEEKNYASIYYWGVILIFFNFLVAYNLKVVEIKKSGQTFKHILKTCKKVYVLTFFFWVTCLGIFSAILWNFLFWYLEDIVKVNDTNQIWIKTIQGMAMGIQCLGGEVPFIFLSGGLIKRLGHRNCMSLVLFTFAIRFFLYSILTNPIWVLPIEILNGITFGLAYPIIISYVNQIALPNTMNTLIGFSQGLFDGIGASLGGLLGGYLYEIYGGSNTFRLFSYGSLSLGILHVLYTTIGKPEV
ncbi:major facilitator superfamily domain-containing protein 6-like isoform X2 [Daktulosphaira vitifoliae]|nr:major facilitator superfamily domain-containing protein 6-like isoform X2 [Daktulosphaira vitifoliae]XP_050548930.1 major facilitator superfamily domain-containing protein 6-like isoform X2 [Daktulosphaira vitifoliae]